MDFHLKNHLEAKNPHPKKAKSTHSGTSATGKTLDTDAPVATERSDGSSDESDSSQGDDQRRPSFISHYADGKPVYREVLVFPLKDAEELKIDIIKQEFEERQLGKSEDFKQLGEEGVVKSSKEEVVIEKENKEEEPLYSMMGGLITKMSGSADTLVQEADEI